MVSFPTPKNFTYNTFGGIRLRNGVVSNGMMTAEICQNIDFIPQSLSSTVKIQSSKGNTVYTTLANYSIVKGFETTQEGIKYCLIYAENDDNGALFKLNTDKTFTTILDGTTTGQTLTKTGKANGITMVDSAYDVFAFTNGVEYYKISFEENPQFVKLNPIYNSEAVTGLALAEQDGSLVIGSDKGYVIASRKGDLTDWDYVTPTDTNKAWYQLFGKPITAVVPYSSGLIVFTADDSTILSGNMSSASTAVRANASMGGCMSFESWLKHDKYLFFYDNIQKNIYFFQQNDYGQIQLGQAVAVEVQQMFDDITRFQMVGYIANNRNEIWILTNTHKFVLDYAISEWTERVCQDNITSYFVFGNQVYSTTTSGQVLKEKDGVIGQYGYVNSSNEGVFIGSKYTMQSIDFGSPSNLKEMELPPIFTVTCDYRNEFTVDVLINDKKSKSKKLSMPSNDYATFWNGLSIPMDKNKFGTAKFAPDLSGNKKQLKAKQVSNFYTMKFTISTSQKGQSFSISAFELKQITQETDTMGHK